MEGHEILKSEKNMNHDGVKKPSNIAAILTDW